MNKVELSGRGWSFAVKIDSDIQPELKKIIYSFVENMLNYVPSLNSENENSSQSSQEDGSNSSNAM